VAEGQRGALVSRRLWRQAEGIPSPSGGRMVRGSAERLRAVRASAWWAVLPLLVLSPALTAPARGQDTPPPPGQKKPGQQPGQQQPGQQQPGQQPGQQQPGQPGQQPGTPPPGGQQPPPTTPGIPPPVEPQRLEPQTIEPQTIEPDLVEPQPLPLPGPTDPDATGEPDLDGAEPGPWKLSKRNHGPREAFPGGGLPSPPLPGDLFRGKKRVIISLHERFQMNCM